MEVGFSLLSIHAILFMIPMPHGLLLLKVKKASLLSATLTHGLFIYLSLSMCTVNAS